MGKTEVQKKRKNSNSPFSFQVKRDADDAYAERNAAFIFKFACKISSFCPDFSISNEAEVHQTPFQQGLYIFYIETHPHQYPIYVVITRRTFRQRFVEHLNSGVIFKFFNGIFPQSIQPAPHYQAVLKVKCVPLPNPIQAKLMESVMLATFDFCLNTEENGNIRGIIDARRTYTIHQSKPMSDHVFGNVMGAINSVYNEYRRNSGWNK